MTEAYTQKRARWAARRGMLELDVILIPFIEKHYQQLTPAQQEQVTALLNADDPDL